MAPKTYREEQVQIVLNGQDRSMYQAMVYFGIIAAHHDHPICLIDREILRVGFLEEMKKVVDTNDLETVYYLGKAGCNFADLFEFACERNNMTLAEEILRHEQADVRLLHRIACSKGTLGMVKLATTYLKEDGFTAGVVEAIKAGKIEVLEFLLEERGKKQGDADQDIIKDVMKEIMVEDTVFQTACRHGQLEIIKRHIPSMSKQFQLSHYHQYLFYACQSGNVDLVLYLLGVIGLCFHENETAGYLKAAIDSGKLEMVKFVLSRCRDLVERIEDIPSFGFMHACSRGHVDIAKYFIEKGARNFKQTVVTHSHRLISHFEIVKLINDHAGKEISWDCVLKAALIFDNIDIIEYLVNDHGAKLLNIWFWDYVFSHPTRTKTGIIVLTKYQDSSHDIWDRPNHCTPPYIILKCIAEECLLKTGVLPNDIIRDCILPFIY